VVADARIRPALELVARLEASGVAFRLDGEHLALVPAERVTDRDVAELRANKAGVMAVLSGEDPGVESRRLVFEAAGGREGAGPVAALEPWLPAPRMCGPMGWGRGY
jgi:hypothetical protein